ncbi:hypothetical protein [Nonomuraea sp. NPDC049758]|uniref:hypothetical protein n=1 Tax=Nonomuraea sp. NPDC049758 TaxID=3154360 RepID=UPI0034157214
MTQLPAEAYPVAVHSADRHLTPDSVRVESTEAALMLWIGDMLIGVPLDSDDTRLQAALNLAWHTRSVIERFGAQVRARLEERERERAAEPTLAAMRAVDNPARPAVVPLGEGSASPTPGARA